MYGPGDRLESKASHFLLLPLVCRHTKLSLFFARTHSPVLMADVLQGKGGLFVCWLVA